MAIKVDQFYSEFKDHLEADRIFQSGVLEEMQGLRRDIKPMVNAITAGSLIWKIVLGFFGLLAMISTIVAAVRSLFKS